MEIKINTQEKDYIFRPSLNEEINQNIENIVTRIRYNLPLARHKGTVVENIDKPQEIVKASITADLVEEIDREEPRFKIDEITVSTQEISIGKLSATIKGEINE